MILILLTLFFGLIIYILWERRFYYMLSWQLNGPIGLPILGNLTSFVGSQSKKQSFDLNKFKKKI